MLRFELLVPIACVVLAIIVLCVPRDFGSSQKKKRGFRRLANALSKPAPLTEEVYGIDAAQVDKDIAELCALFRQHMPEELQQETDDLQLAVLAREYLVTFAREMTDSSVRGYLEWWGSSTAQNEASRLMKKDDRALSHAKRAHQLKASGALREAFIDYGKALQVWGYGSQSLSYVRGRLTLSKPIEPFAG